MSASENKFKNTFQKKGFFIKRNFFEKNLINKIFKEVNLAKGVIKYYDKKKNIRRIEKLYNKGTYLKYLNKKIKDYLSLVFKKKFIIFKDKYNAKPPGGEGFFAHYDGIFYFKNDKNKKKKGWYEYSNLFINVLIALDASNQKNGTIEIAKKHNGSFKKLLKNTYNDGTPNITREIEKKTSFKAINLKVGDIVIFSNKCPHRSNKNITNQPRRNLYYTYTCSSDKTLYKRYFNDKKKSKNNTKKSLEGKI
jgi:ectoine hydroxylase-related dioxygenase (phytanoyl-CoA dioxygenase family)